MKLRLIGLLLALTLPVTAQDAWISKVVSKATDAAAILQTGGKGTTRAQAGAGLLEMFEESSAIAKQRQQAEQDAASHNSEAIDNATADLAIALMNLENKKRQLGAATEMLNNLNDLGEVHSRLDLSRYLAWQSLIKNLEMQVRMAEISAQESAEQWKVVVSREEAREKERSRERGSLDQDGGDERGPGVMNTGMPAGNSSPGGGSPTMCPGH